MLRIYQRLNNWFSSFMSTHEKGLFTTGAKVMAAVCTIVAMLLAHRCSSQLF